MPTTRRAWVLLLSVAVIATVTTGIGPPASASVWAVGVQAGSKAQARAGTAPATPASVTATCTSPSSNTVSLGWAAVTHATSYKVYRSTTTAGGTYSLQTTVTVTAWTTGALANGNYWFKVSALVGASWVSTQSSATTQRTISGTTCA